MTYKKVDKLIEKRGLEIRNQAAMALLKARETVATAFDKHEWTGWMGRINNGLPLHKNYTFTVKKVVEKGWFWRVKKVGIETVLTNKENGKSKTFWIAGDKDAGAITTFMRTLTDEQCDSHVGIKFKGKK